MRSICPHSGGGGYGHGGHECRGAAALALRGGQFYPQTGCRMAWVSCIFRHRCGADRRAAALLFASYGQLRAFRYDGHSIQ